MKTASELVLQDETLHDRVVRDIASHRFGLDEWNVTTLPSEIPAGTDLKVIPDILATHGDAVVAVGEVETGSISSEHARQWKALGESCVRFYLYVPDREINTACRLISQHEIACAGIRSYKYNGKLEIRPVYFEDALCKEDDHPWWVALGGNDQSC